MRSPITLLRQVMNKLQNAPNGVPSTLTIETDMPAEALKEALRRWQPWRHDIRFSNGVRTSDLEMGRTYTDAPLRKLQIVAANVPLEALRGGRALDIGCNAGYNSVFLARDYGMRVTGVDVVPRHVEVSRFLAGLVPGVNTEFILHDATTFAVPDEFDLILHFGTLYHLPNPLLSLENAARSLKPGGYLALETNGYNGTDPAQCRWIRGLNNDKTNFWALSKPVLEEILDMYGLEDVRLVAEIGLSKQPWAAGTGITRVLYTARKGGAGRAR